MSSKPNKSWSERWREIKTAGKALLVVGVAVVVGRVAVIAGQAPQSPAPPPPRPLSRHDKDPDKRTKPDELKIVPGFDGNTEQFFRGPIMDRNRDKNPITWDMGVAFDKDDRLLADQQVAIAIVRVGKKNGNQFQVRAIVVTKEDEPIPVRVMLQESRPGTKDRERKVLETAIATRDQRVERFDVVDKYGNRRPHVAFYYSSDIIELGRDNELVASSESPVLETKTDRRVRLNPEKENGLELAGGLHTAR